MKPHPPGHLFAVGRIVGSWGRRGMVKVKPLTDFPEKLPGKGKVFVWREDTGERAFRIREGRLARGMVILGLEGVESIDEAQAVRGSLIMVEEEGLEPLPEGSYYRHQIIGLEVVGGDGEGLGRVEEIMDTGACDVYVVRGEGEEILIPAVREFILGIDLAAGKMTVERPRETGAEEE